MQPILIIGGPTASGKSARAVEEALKRGGEVISVDSRQLYRGLDIGTEKISREEMRGIPHHLIDVLDASQPYSAGEFAEDAARLIEEIASRGKLPILAGGTHYYYDALLSPTPQVPTNEPLRAELELLSNEELLARIQAADPRRASELDPKNRRRLIRALEIIAAKGKVPERSTAMPYQVEWMLVEPPEEDLRKRIDSRLAAALERGLIEEVAAARDMLGDARLAELGLEYKVIGDWLAKGAETPRALLLPALSAKLWQYARRQRAWLRKLRDKYSIDSASSSLLHTR